MIIKLNKVLGSKNTFHFVHKKTPHLRSRRDVVVSRSLVSNEKLVKRAIQQVGFRRIKRGYKTVEDLKTQFPEYKPPTDPYFQYQWYLVSYNPDNPILPHLQSYIQ